MRRLSFSLLKFISIPTVLSASLTLFSGAVWATPSVDAKQVLERMSTALQEKSYQGIFVYRRGDDLSAMHVTHLAHPHGEQERLVSLTGQEREMTRNNRRGGAGKPSLGQFALERLASVESYYDLKVLGEARVAGRYAKLLSVTPRDEFRYGYRLWVDDETGLLLKSDLLDDERVLEQVMFTFVDLIDPPEVARALQPIPEETMDEVELDHDKGRWLVGELPAGFQLVSLHLAGTGEGVEHMVFSDGLASVSVFVEAIVDEEHSFVGFSRQGAVNAYGNVVDGHQVTVVGEVPKAAVKRMGASLKLKQ